jgi:hypothetical protein
MSGLILAGIGKGIADAGQTFGSFMMQGIQDQRKNELEALREERQSARELARDERQSVREEERETRKTASIEAAALKDADIYAKAEEAAPGIGEARRFEKFKKDLGQTDMAEDELRQVFKDQYDQTKVGAFEGADRYVERYSKQKEDVLSEIRRGGGSSGLINQAVAEVKGAREAERVADRLAFDERRLNEVEQRRRDEFKALLPITQQKADAGTTRAGAAVTSAGASVTRANRPPATGRSGTVSGMSEVKLNQEAETLRKAAKDASSMDARRDYEARLKEVMDEIQARRKSSGASAPKTGDNSGARPPLSSFAR